MWKSYLRTISANPLLAMIGFGVLLLCAAALVMTDTLTFIKIALSVIFFLVLLRRPELALAIQFNGVALYLYVVYKLAAETDSIVTGGFYSAVAAAYLAGGWHLARARRLLRISVVDWLFFALYGLFFISYLIFSLDNPNALKKVTYAPVLVIAPYLGLQLLSSREQVQRFFLYCAGLTVLMMLPSAYELLTNPYYGDYGRFSIFIFTDKGDNPIQFGISFALLILFTLFRIAAQRRIGFWHLAIILPSIYFLVRSGARGPLISFVVALLFYIVWLGELRPRIKLTLLGGLAALLIAAFSLVPTQTTTFYQALVDPNIAPSRDPSANSIQERMIFMEQAINEFLASPIIGVGTGNSSGGIGYPHNVFIEVAAEFGFLGLLIFLPLCVVVIRTAIKHIRNPLKGQTDWLMNLAFATFIFALVEALFSAYMGGDVLFYGSMGMISVIAKLYEQDAPIESEERVGWIDRYVESFGTLSGKLSAR